MVDWGRVSPINGSLVKRRAGCAKVSRQHGLDNCHPLGIGLFVTWLGLVEGQPPWCGFYLWPLVTDIGQQHWWVLWRLQPPGSWSWLQCHPCINQWVGVVPPVSCTPLRPLVGTLGVLAVVGIGACPIFIVIYFIFHCTLMCNNAFTHIMYVYDTWFTWCLLLMVVCFTFYFTCVSALQGTINKENFL